MKSPSTPPAAHRWALASALLLCAAGAAAQDFPRLSGRVVDQASLLEPADETQLGNRLAALEANTQRQFVVATVTSLAGKSIEDYGYQLGREWRIGRVAADDGVILLVAPNERKVRIEVGYGLEGVLTDALSSTIIHAKILPLFRRGDFAGGILVGAEAIAAHLELPEDEARARAADAEDGGGGAGTFFIATAVLLGLYLLNTGFRRRKRHGRRKRGRGRGSVVVWGPGGGGGYDGGGGRSHRGGGGFSGGGGSFGGGGASGSW